MQPAHCLPRADGFVEFVGLNPTESAFAQELIAYWISFIRSGNPNTYKLPGSPTWNSFSNGNARIVLQQGPDGDPAHPSGSFLEAESDAERDRCALVASKASRLQY